MAASALLLPSTTPPDYHRIISPTLRIPIYPDAIPVGLLACQRDPLLRELKTTVVSCAVHQAASASVSGKKNKKSSALPAPSGHLLEIVLHDTVIFPEGGGQPSDIGNITASDYTTREVVQVKRHGGHAVHYVAVKDTQADVFLFSPGAKVIVALGKDGFDRRYDHMSMHTSQHLLSALLETRLNLPTLSWSLTAHPAPCYVEVPRGMTTEEIMSIQDEANRLVFEGRKVHVEVEELIKDQEPAVVKLESGRSVGKALPGDYTGGVRRVVVIDGIDRNPCCGTHLPTLHNLQIFLLPHTDALSRSATTSARLYFLAGPRLINHLSSTHNLLTGAAATLSCGPPQVPDRVGQVMEERKKGDKRVEDLEGELAGWVAKDLCQQMLSTQNEVFCKHIHRTDDSANALGFLSAISSAFMNSASTSTSAPGSYVIALSSSPSSMIASNVNVILLFGSDEEKIKQVAEGLKAKLGVKGGGKGLKWSGKFIGIWKDTREDAVVQDTLTSVVGV